MPFRPLHGQRRGRPLSPSLRTHLQHLDDYNVSAAVTQARQTRRSLDPTTLFPAATTIWLEIGIGSGEHLVHHSTAHRTIGFIGCDVFMRGIASTVGKLRAAQPTNVRIYPGDVRDLLDVLPDRSIACTFLMFPDPWPKRRHHKRRFVNPATLDPLARVMPPGAELRIATDVADYVRQTLTTLQIHGTFEWTARRQADWQTRWPDSIPTRYETKALSQSRRCTYLTYCRRD